MTKSIVLGLCGLLLVISATNCRKSEKPKKPGMTNAEIQAEVKDELTSRFNAGNQPKEIAAMLEPEDFAVLHYLRTGQYALNESYYSEQPNNDPMLIITEENRKEELMYAKYYKQEAEPYVSECYRILENYLKNHPEKDHHWIYWSLGECFTAQGDLVNARLYYTKGLDHDYGRLWCLEALVHITYWDFEKHIITEKQAIKDFQYYGGLIYQLLPYSFDAYYQRVQGFEYPMEHIKKYRELDRLDYHSVRRTHSYMWGEHMDALQLPKQQWEMFKHGEDLAIEVGKYMSTADEYLKDGKNGASDLYLRSIKWWKYIAGASVYAQDGYYYESLKPIEEKIGGHISDAPNMVVGDAYMRYAEIFQKEVDAGRKSEVYNTLSKQAKNDMELRQLLKDYIIESYKKAAFCYIQDLCSDDRLFERDYRQIAECRKRIRELEGRPEPPQPPSPK